MERTVLATLAVVCGAISASAQNLSADDLARRTIERRAIEAVNWGMSAVNTDLMLQEMLNKTAGKVNQVVYWSRPLDWHNQTLTPNPDAIYFMAFFNTKDAGPIVLEIPPAGDDGSLNGNIVDFWQVPLEDAGPSGADAGKGGKYLLLPPGYAGPVPEGYIALRPATFGSYALLRSNLKSHGDADVAKSVAYGKKVKVYPLSQAANPPPTVFTDAANVVFDSTIRYDVSFFTSLDRVVQSEPWLPRDRAMIDMLRSLGIEKGKPFNPDAKTKAMLDAAAREAQAWLELQIRYGSSALLRGRPVDGSGGARASCRRAGGLQRSRTNIRSMLAASPTPSRLSASSASAPASSIWSASGTRTAIRSTAARPIG